MEKVFSPADEEGHSVSSSSPSTHRLIPLHQRRFLLCACCGPMFLTPPSPNHINARCFRCLHSTYAIKEVARWNTGTVHMRSACGTRTGRSETEWAQARRQELGFSRGPCSSIRLLLVPWHWPWRQQGNTVVIDLKCVWKTCRVFGNVVSDSLRLPPLGFTAAVGSAWMTET